MARRIINTIDELEKAIAESENLVQQKHAELKEQFHITKASLNPATIAKNSFGNILGQFTGNGNIGSLLVKAIGGITAGVVANKVASPKNNGLSFSTFIRNSAKAWGIAMLANNADKLIAYGTAIFQNLFSASKKNEELVNENTTQKEEAYHNN